MPVTIEKKTPAGQPVRPGRRPRLRLGALIGSGDRIGALVLPFVLAGVAFTALAAGGIRSRPRRGRRRLGVVGAADRHEGACRRAGHDWTVLAGQASAVYIGCLAGAPWLGFLLDTWLGALLGIVLYVASRLLAPAEEAELADRFGAE